MHIFGYKYGPWDRHRLDINADVKQVKSESESEHEREHCMNKISVVVAVAVAAAVKYQSKVKMFFVL